MSENKNKTPLEEALNNFEEIKKFAQEQAAQALESKVEETLKEFFDKKLNEDTTINIDSTGNVEITTDGEVVSPEGETTADADEVDLAVDSNEDSEDEFQPRSTHASPVPPPMGSHRKAGTDINKAKQIATRLGLTNLTDDEYDIPTFIRRQQETDL
jgi:hypothetical protein